MIKFTDLIPTPKRPQHLRGVVLQDVLGSKASAIPAPLKVKRCHGTPGIAQVTCFFQKLDSHFMELDGTRSVDFFSLFHFISLFFFYIRIQLECTALSSSFELIGAWLHQQLQYEVSWTCSDRGLI